MDILHGEIVKNVNVKIVYSPILAIISYRLGATELAKAAGLIIAQGLDAVSSIII